MDCKISLLNLQGYYICPIFKCVVLGCSMGETKEYKYIILSEISKSSSGTNESIKVEESKKKVVNKKWLKCAEQEVCQKVILYNLKFLRYSKDVSWMPQQFRVSASKPCSQATELLYQGIKWMCGASSFDSYQPWNFGPVTKPLM